jgi:hypothetical protein
MSLWIALGLALLLALIVTPLVVRLRSAGRRAEGPQNIYPIW